MCIAVPMMVTQINKESNSAKVSLSGNELDVNISLVDVKEGDYVLVHAGCAIEIIRKETADEIAEIYEMLDEAYDA